MKNRKHKKWTDEEIEILRNWKGSIFTCADYLGRTPDAIKSMKRKINNIEDFTDAFAALAVFVTIIIFLICYFINL